MTQRRPFLCLTTACAPPLPCARKKCTPAIACYLDGVEVLNCSPWHDSHNDRAEEYAALHGLLRTGGSDCHRTEDIGRWHHCALPAGGRCGVRPAAAGGRIYAYWQRVTSCSSSRQLRILTA
ncbi:MAG: hypothetical protein K2O45_02260 [Oscillospiraceae bacterium]|nr:hypothetical protein [Oscillospiraceae bacterium]